MFCDKDYRCLCSYLLDDITNEQKIELLEQLPDLCPLCRGCQKRDDEIRLQKKVKSLLQDLKNCYHLSDTEREKIIKELEDINLYRETGIEALDLVKCHSHIALICKGYTDPIEIIQRFIAKGIENDELCLNITSKTEMDDMHTHLKNDITNSHLRVIPLNGLLSSIENGKKEELLRFPISQEGHNSIRLVGELSNFEDDIYSCVTRYESFAQDLTSRYPAIALCIYHVSIYNRPEITGIVDIHDHIIYQLEDGWKVKTRK